MGPFHQSGENQSSLVHCVWQALNRLESYHRICSSISHRHVSMGDTVEVFIYSTPQLSNGEKQPIHFVSFRVKRFFVGTWDGGDNHLPVEHSHCGVDQFSSLYSERLQHHNAVRATDWHDHLFQWAIITHMFLARGRFPVYLASLTRRTVWAASSCSLIIISSGL